MFIKFATALSWIVGAPCAFCLLLLVILRVFVKESPSERSRTEGSMFFYVKWGVVAWAWLFARYIL